MVLRKEGHTALVRVARVNCAECGGCGLLARRREHIMEFTARNTVGAEVGDEVILYVPSSRLAQSYLLLFGLPLLAMAAAFALVTVPFALAGRGDVQGAAIMSAVAAGLAAFWGGIKLAERRGFSPVITAVLRQADNGESRGEYRGGVL